MPINLARISLKYIAKKLGYEIRRAPLTVPAQIDKRLALFNELCSFRSESSGNTLLIDERQFLIRCLRSWQTSSAQIFQDLFVLEALKDKREGFFVEFGATNGRDISNTWLLEREYAWRGILAEPAPHWHADLRRNRNCTISTDCVWKRSGEELMFNEAPDKELSTIDAFSNSDTHRESRLDGRKYVVKSISLFDLLRNNDAPKIIDYLSIDTEGSEFEILADFDFSAYQVRVVTVEHNHSPQREKIYALLSANGFYRVLEKYSQWDDWYVRADLLHMMLGDMPAQRG